ncbi:MAG TPA: hypothetical protein PLL06_15110, partial [Acidobacteriota bacterium]|nr:hypothetical protein [Acidobacteriota bacterium]
MRLTENLSSRAKRLTGFLMVLTLLGFAAMPFLPAPSSLASRGKGLINKVFSTSRQEKSVPQEEKQKELTNEEKNALIEAEQKKSQESGDFSKTGVFAPNVPVAPSNDMCSGAVVIPASGPFPHVTPLINVFSATSTNDAVRTCGIGTGGTGSDFLGVWFRFTPTTTGLYR